MKILKEYLSTKIINTDNIKSYEDIVKNNIKITLEDSPFFDISNDKIKMAFFSWNLKILKTISSINIRFYKEEDCQAMEIKIDDIKCKFLIDWDSVHEYNLCSSTIKFT